MIKRISTQFILEKKTLNLTRCIKKWIEQENSKVLGTLFQIHFIL